MASTSVSTFRPRSVLTSPPQASIWASVETLMRLAATAQNATMGVIANGVLIATIGDVRALHVAPVVLVLALVLVPGAATLDAMPVTCVMHAAHAMPVTRVTFVTCVMSVTRVMPVTCATLVTLAMFAASVASAAPAQDDSLLSQSVHRQSRITVKTFSIININQLLMNQSK